MEHKNSYLFNCNKSGKIGICQKFTFFNAPLRETSSCAAATFLAHAEKKLRTFKFHKSPRVSFAMLKGEHSRLKPENLFSTKGQ